MARGMGDLFFLTLEATLITSNNDGLEELVCLALLVTLLDGLDRVLAGLALALDKTLHGDLDTLPPLVTVHGVVTADNRGDLADAELLDLVLKLLHVGGAGLGVGVASIAEEVDVDLGDLVLLGGFEKSIEVSLLGVLWSFALACTRDDGWET